MATLHDALRRSAEELRSSLRSTRPVQHHGVMGSLREKDVRRVLSTYLPKRIQVMTGQIENTRGQQSRQQDCILLDSLHTVPFLISEDEGTFPIEAVRGTIEVKSNTNRKTLDEAIKNVASAKAMADPKDEWIPFGGIVCMAGTTSTSRIAKTFFELCHLLNARERCDALVVVDQCALFWGDVQDGSPRISDPTLTDDLIVIESSEYALLVFLLAMFDNLNRQVPPVLSLFSYVNSANVELSYRTVQASSASTSLEELSNGDSFPGWDGLYASGRA
jgi:hypothetical protein